MLFLMRIGMPWRGERIVPLARSASSVAAMVSASGFSSTTGWRVLFTSLMRAV
jgi:hypothetical protein